MGEPIDGAGAEPARHRLLGLEAGRFAAALLVACFHFTQAFQNVRGTTIFDTAFRGGHAGVEYFFVLSGFIITWVHTRDIGHPERLRAFAVKRFIRLYPMFWLITAVMLVLFLVPSSVSGHRVLSGPGLLLDWLLLPTSGSMIVQQSWSLRHEIVFYALFAVAIWNGRAGLAVLVLWQLAVLALGLMHPADMPAAWMPLFYLYNLGFGLGMVTAWLTRRMRCSWPGLVALLGLAGFVACLTVEWWIGRAIPEPALPLGDIRSPMLYLGCSALIIFGLTQYEMRRPLPGQALLRLLGGSSYVLYLVHGLVGSILIRLFMTARLAAVPGPIVFATMLIGAITTAVVLHLLVEKPVLRLLRDRLLGSPGDTSRAGYRVRHGLRRQGA